VRGGSDIHIMAREPRFTGFYGISSFMHTPKDTPKGNSIKKYTVDLFRINGLLVPSSDIR
jgi:hypothetical protein